MTPSCSGLAISTVLRFGDETWGAITELNNVMGLFATFIIIFALDLHLSLRTQMWSMMELSHLEDKASHTLRRKSEEAL